MRKFLKKNILDVFQTMFEAHKQIVNFLENQELGNACIVLEDCQNAAVQIGTAIEESEGEGLVSVTLLEEYCEAVYQISTNIMEECDCKEMQDILDNKLIMAEESVKNDIKVKLEIVFLPYKASMWDSLESVWMAANDDPDCDAYVVPIPYYDRRPDGSFGEFHYEGGCYPENVPIVHYENYNFEEHCPDIIYIHNPYEDLNYVTSVDPRFYSRELKKYTDCLVYIPYFVAGYYLSVQSAKRYIPPCIEHVDLVMLQSDNQKKGYEYAPKHTEKMIVMGSPKIDKIVNEISKFKEPQELIEKIAEKKVIMVNSSISRILNDAQWYEKMEELIKVFENNTNIFLLWRPHPLLMTTVDAMRPYDKNKMLSLIERINEIENSYVDTNPSADMAISISDGLISDYSSLVLQYTATGKPILLTAGSSVFRDTRFVCCDYFSNYFINDGMSIEQFCLMVCENNDHKKEERMHYFFMSIKNSDGTCGKKIHEYVKERERIIS